MNPPDHIKGPNIPLKGEFYRNARNEWIKAQLDAGETVKAVCAALGVSEGSVRHAMRGIGYVVPKPDYRPSYRHHNSCGINLGALGKVFFNMPDSARDAILSTCAKTGKTIAQVLADAYVEANL